jgi:hypothetical protein
MAVSDRCRRKLISSLKWLFGNIKFHLIRRAVKIWSGDRCGGKVLCVGWLLVRMPVLVELVDSCRPEVSIWGVWRMACALYMLLSFLKILTRDNHNAHEIGS